MKPLFSLLTFFLFSCSVFAQVADYTAVDCQNDSMSIYQVLATGKPLLIASEGTDCSVCKNKAPGLEAWAANNATKVQVWAAMTKTYSSTNPNCQELNSWITTYNWSTIFTFVDAQKRWRDQGTPRYYVYDPRDSSLAYNGFDEALAQQTALNISAQTLSVPLKQTSLKEVKLQQGKKMITLVNLPPTNYVIEIVDLTGKVVFKTSTGVQHGSFTMSTAGLKPSLYLIRVNNKKGEATVLKTMVQ